MAIQRTGPIKFSEIATEFPSADTDGNPLTVNILSDFYRGRVQDYVHSGTAGIPYDANSDVEDNPPLSLSDFYNTSASEFLNYYVDGDSVLENGLILDFTGKTSGVSVIVVIANEHNSECLDFLDNLYDNDVNGWQTSIGKQGTDVVEIGHISSQDPTEPAITIKNVPADSFIWIRNFGYIVGAGGNGGTEITYSNNATLQTPDAGDPGGDGIKVEDATVDLNADILIENWGTIAGGAGGGGAGGNGGTPSNYTSGFTPYDTGSFLLYPFLLIDASYTNWVNTSIYQGGGGVIYYDWRSQGTEKRYYFGYYHLKFDDGTTMDEFVTFPNSAPTFSTTKYITTTSSSTPAAQNYWELRSATSFYLNNNDESPLSSRTLVPRGTTPINGVYQSEINIDSFPYYDSSLTYSESPTNGPSVSKLRTLVGTGSTMATEIYNGLNGLSAPSSYKIYSNTDKAYDSISFPDITLAAQGGGDGGRGAHFTGSSSSGQGGSSVNNIIYGNLDTRFATTWYYGDGGTGVDGNGWSIATPNSPNPELTLSVVTPTTTNNGEDGSSTNGGNPGAQGATGNAINTGLSNVIITNY